MDFGVSDLLPGPLSIAAADTSRFRKKRPLTLPGGDLEPFASGFLRRFRGEDFQLQFKTAGGTGASFEGEICGMRSYRRKTWSASYSGSNWNGSIVTSYVFNPEDPEIDWEVEVLTVTTGSTPNSPVYLRVDQPDHGLYSVVETLPSGSEKLLTVGTSDFSDEVTYEFLRDEAIRFSALSEDYREAVSTAGFNAGRTGTPNGWFAWVEVAWYRAEADLSADEEGFDGFAGAFNLMVDLEEKRNLPVLYDEGNAEASGLGLYTTGTRTWSLSEPIGTKIWKDEHGTFDAEEAALEEIGWIAGEDNLIAPLTNGGTSGMAKGCFLGVDGETVWRVTIEAGKYVGEDWVVVQTLVVTVPPQDLTEWGFTQATLISGAATGWQFTKLEMQEEGGGWSILAEDFDCYTYIRPDFYNANAKVFWAGRWRAGDRWGFPELNEASPGDGSNYYKTRRLIHDRTCSSNAEE